MKHLLFLLGVFLLVIIFSIFKNMALSYWPQITNIKWLLDIISTFVIILILMQYIHKHIKT